MTNQKLPSESFSERIFHLKVNYADVLPSVVLVGFWDEDTQSITSLGSGFMVDKKRGLIMTTAHTLFQINGNKDNNFGKDYFGKKGKVVIGVIPDDGNNNGTRAIFRYRAIIAAKDQMMTSGKNRCEIDACVLKIVTRLDCDVDSDGNECGNQGEEVICEMRKEGLEDLKIDEHECKVNESVASIGFSQEGEGRQTRQVWNRNFDFNRGYITMPKLESNVNEECYVFSPTTEIVVWFNSKPGHSGSPCINEEGKVLGMVSRQHPGDATRCYLVPAQALNVLLKIAKRRF